MELAYAIRGESDPVSLRAALHAFATDSRNLFKRDPADRFALWSFALLGLDHESEDSARRTRWEQLRRDVERRTNDGTASGVISGSAEQDDDEDEDPLLKMKDGGRWSKVFHYQQTYEQIRKDVDRMFVSSDGVIDDFMADVATRILLLWAQVHDSLSYKQGMHEILKPLLDTAKDSGKDLSVHEADLYFMFDAILSPLVSLYSDDAVTGTATSAAAKPTLRSTCDDIRDRLLLRAAPDLKNHLDRLGIDLQIFALRWLRCLFTREFDNQPSYLYGFWDIFIAEAFLAPEPRFSLIELASFFSVANILRVRNAIMSSTLKHEALESLMRPPPLQSDAEALQLALQSLQLRVLGDKPVARSPLEIAQDKNSRLGFRLKTILGALEREVLKGKEHVDEGRMLELIAQAKQIQDVLLRRLGEDECFWST